MPASLVLSSTSSNTTPSLLTVLGTPVAVEPGGEPALPLVRVGVGALEVEAWGGEPASGPTRATLTISTEIYQKHPIDATDWVQQRERVKAWPCRAL